jgi:CRISPR-associated protein Csx10
MALTLTFEITLDSDYHVSAGQGLGSLIDSALHRDVDGIPVLRGTTLTGLLRDGLYRLLQLAPLSQYKTCKASGLTAKHEPEYCGQKDPQQADCPVCQIFGSPRTVKHWTIGSARPKDLGKIMAAKESWDAGGVAGYSVPHVRVSPRTRRAEEHKLFFREEGDARLSFVFDIVCAGEDATALEEAAWLVAAARYVRHLGAGRRRGRGACTIALSQVQAEGALAEELPQTDPQAWFLSKFEAYHLLETETAPVVSVPDFASTPVAKTEGPLRYLMLVRLDEPLLLSEKAAAGNEFHTLDYVPGTALRGAFAGRAAAHYALEKDAAAYAAFHALFFRNQVRFTPLYPAYRVEKELYPTLPAPHALLTCSLYKGFAVSDKDKQHHGAFNYALGATAEEHVPACSQCDAPMKPFQGFLPLRKNPEPLDKHYVTEMHVHIHPITGKAAGGDLFSFNALAPGHYLLGEIEFASAQARQDFWELCALPDDMDNKGLPLQLGKASHRGYGAVTLWLQTWQSTTSVWHGAPLETRVGDLSGSLTLTLLTDAVLPDPWGRFRVDLDAAWLTSLLADLEDDQAPPKKLGVKIHRRFCSARPVDAFNAYLGLPRWRDVAVRAGSAVGFELTGVTERNRLQILAWMQTLEREGVGLRRNEGFGRVAFNHPLYDGCAHLQTPSIRLSQTMRLGSGGARHSLKQETDFTKKWQAYLAERKPQDDVLAQKELAPLARLLQTTRPGSIADVEALLVRFGDSSELLPTEILETLTAREKDKVTRKYIKSDKAARALQELRANLEELDSRIAALLPREGNLRQWAWRSGLQALADRIAAVAGKEKEA